MGLIPATHLVQPVRAEELESRWRERDREGEKYCYTFQG